MAARKKDTKSLAEAAKAEVASAPKKKARKKSSKKTAKKADPLRHLKACATTVREAAAILENSGVNRPTRSMAPTTRRRRG